VRGANLRFSIMHISQHERPLLPFIALQGAVSTLAGFIGYFVVGNQDIGAMFRFTALMMTIASLAALLSYWLGPKFGLCGKRLMRLGFLVPGVLLIAGGESVLNMAAAFGSFLGLTWSARHWLEMNLLADAERDSYASRSGALAVMGGIVATLVSTVLLAKNGEQSRHLYWMYGAVCLLGAWRLGRCMPEAPLKPLKNPLAVMKQPEFIACLPLFFLESGLFGLGHAVGSVGAAHAIGSASSFGWVATVAGLAGGVGLYLTRKNRAVENRAGWLGASCFAVAASFILLGASAWLPVLFVGYSVLKAVAGPFLAASELVLNQRALELRGELADRIVARDLMLWCLRMSSLLAFWLIAESMTPAHLVAIGSGVMGLAVVFEDLVGRGWFAEDSPIAVGHEAAQAA
jgi:hypothetical protein